MTFWKRYIKSSHTLTIDEIPSHAHQYYKFSFHSVPLLFDLKFYGNAAADNSTRDKES